MKALAPWQVWWVDLDPQVGREQHGRRPAIVVGTPLACRLPNGLVLVVPCTQTDRRLPWHPPVTLDGTPGFAMCDQIRSLSVDRLVNLHRATLDPQQIAGIREALSRLLDI